MAKKTEPTPEAKGKKNEAAIKAHRQQIDKLDLQILDLINRRADFARKIGELKATTGADIFAPAREEQVIANLLANNKGPMPEATIQAIYREIISGSRAIQRVTKVAFLGPEYSFSHLAMLERFGASAEAVQVSSIAAVFEEINRRHVDYGVVPLENSTDGRVADTLDMFIRQPGLKICSEVRLRIHHHLLANCKHTEIRRVYSKPQALSQCRNWLARNVPQASLHEVTSTTAAAQLATQQEGAAAVASRQAAVRYDLRLVFENIEDSPHNETRFAVIGTHDSPRTGRDKTALMFQVKHASGALGSAVDPFGKHKVNLLWIESFPNPTAKGKYIFFVDFEGHADEAKVKKLIADLEAKCDSLTNLGSFPLSKPVE